MGMEGGYRRGYWDIGGKALGDGHSRYYSGVQRSSRDNLRKTTGCLKDRSLGGDDNAMSTTSSHILFVAPHEPRLRRCCCHCTHFLREDAGAKRQDQLDLYLGTCKSVVNLLKPGDVHL